MPEITTVETIRTKLREFEERVDGAIVAAKTLSRIKVDAERLLTNVHNVAAESEQSLQKTEGIRSQLQKLQRDWDLLRQQLDRARTESDETRKKLLSELDSAVQSLDKKYREVEERLKAANSKSLAEQAALLSKLEGSTRANAETATREKTLVIERVETLNRLLGTAHDELKNEIREKLQQAENQLEAKIKTETGEMRDSLSEHQRTIDRQLSDFLVKQNALVQNLAQQIDGYSRVAQTHSAELATTNRKLSELSSAFGAHTVKTADEMGAVATGIAELKALYADAQPKLASYDQSIASLESTFEETTERLTETLDKLKGLPFFGKKFK